MPGVAVDTLRSSGVLNQVEQQQASLGERPVDDFGSMGRDVERLAARARQAADQGMNRALENLLFRLRELETQDVARVGDGVMHAQPLKPGFHCIR